jgi:hypothetical protein
MNGQFDKLQLYFLNPSIPKIRYGLRGCKGTFY